MIERSKIRVIKPGRGEEAVWGPLADAKARTLVIKIPLTASTYYLVENRQPIGYDRYKIRVSKSQEKR